MWQGDLQSGTRLCAEICQHTQQWAADTALIYAFISSRRVQQKPRLAHSALLGSAGHTGAWPLKSASLAATGVARLHRACFSPQWTCQCRVELTEHQAGPSALRSLLRI